MPRKAKTARQPASKPVSKPVSRLSTPTPSEDSGESRQAKAKPPAKAAAKPKAKTEKPARRKREGLSGLDAAAKILAGAKEPIGCTEIFARIQEQKLWKTGGKTPAATLSAAILREIRDKGKEGRFKKVGRGLFAAAK